MKAALKGVLPIVPTPFAKSGEVDEVSLRNLNDPFYRNTFRLGGRACSFASLFLVVFRP